MRTRARDLAAAPAALTVILALIAPASASNAPPANAPCASPRYVQALGWACEEEGGYRVLLGDGTTVFTHGGDPVPTHSRYHLETKGKRPSCVGDPAREFHVQLVYVRPPDHPDRYSEMLGHVRRIAQLANGVVYADAKMFKRTRSLRMACSRGTPTVLGLTLASINDRQSFSQVMTEVRGAGLASPLAKYWIYYDGRPPGAPAGTGSFESDPQLRADNDSNVGPGYAVTWGIEPPGGASVMLHELGHTLGAVQSTAPRSSGGAHCNDGQDIMCYADDGVNSDYRSNVCRRTYFDCGHNDYYHPNPGRRNYLRRAWNVGSPLNRFLAGCSYRTATLQVDPVVVAASLQDGDLVLARGARHLVPKRCRGRRFALSATRIPLPHDVYATAGGIPRRVDIHPGYAALSPADVDVCFFRGSRRLRCYASSGVSEQGWVPKGATRAQVSLVSGLDALYVLNID